MTSSVPDGPDTELAAAIAYMQPSMHGPGIENEIRFDREAQRHAATIVRAVLARPAAGRDLTASDVVAATADLFTLTREPANVAARLNAVARPAVARTDGQPRTGADLADQRRRERETGTGPFRDDPLSTAERMGAAPADDTAAPDTVAGYVLARVDDGTVTLWDDDVRSSRREVQIAHVEHVDDPPGAGWRCYELRDVCEPAGQPVRDSQDGGA